MTNTLKVDIAIIGAGSGGLSVAAFAAQMGVKVALIEAGKMGGDCLNYGCIPSKSLLAASKVAEYFRRSESFGIRTVEPEIDFTKVIAHVHDVMNTISVNDSGERFTKLGVKVFRAQGKFVDKKTLMVGDNLIRARRFVIATGSIPAIPPIPGVDKITFYTNETIFDIDHKPEHLLIIGGGPVGCELGQAFLLLGSQVTVLEAHHILPHDEPDLVSILREHLIKQGLKIHEGIKIKNILRKENKIEIVMEKNGQEQIIVGSDLLIATGRKPAIKDLNLDAAHVVYSEKEIKVNSKLRTTNRRIYAIGDVVGPYRFTHMANYHAEIALRNILFRLPTHVNYRAVPWVTYTEPELAHVGLTVEEAHRVGAKIKVLEWNFAENDRAQTERKTLGKIKIVANPEGRVLGASILGAHAGDLLIPWIIAVRERKKLRSMTNFIIPYPTFSEIHKRVAGEFYLPVLFSWPMKLLVKVLGWFG